MLLFTLLPIKHTVLPLDWRETIDEDPTWEYSRCICIVYLHSPHHHPMIQTVDSRGWLLDFNNMSCILYTIQHRELVPHSFNLFWITQYEYVPYRSVRWHCVALSAQVQKLWGNLCTFNYNCYFEQKSYYFNKNFRRKCDYFCPIFLFSNKKSLSWAIFGQNTLIFKPNSIFCVVVHLKRPSKGLHKCERRIPFSLFQSVSNLKLKLGNFKPKNNPHRSIFGNLIAIHYFLNLIT